MTRALGRLTAAAFCWLTAVYAFLASSSFAYQQFLRPRVFRSIGLFSDWHAAVYWVWLAVALASLAEHFRHRGTVRRLALAFAATWTLVGIALALHPMVPTLADNPRSIVVGLIALVPIAWIAAIDHVAAWQYLDAQSRPSSEDALRSTEARLFVASVGAAVFSLVLYAALTPLFIADRFEPDLLTRGLVIGLSWNAVDHLVIFLAAFLILAIADRGLARSTSFRARHAGAFALVVATLALIIQRVFGKAIGLDGAWGAAVATGLAVSIASAWSGLRVAEWRRIGARLTSPFDVWFGPPQPARLPRTAGSLALIAVAAYGLAALSSRMDWDFLILTVGVVGIWATAFGALYRATAATLGLRTGTLALVCLLPLAGRGVDAPIARALPRWLGDRGFEVRHTLDRYLIYNPSFRVADAVFHDPSGDSPSFDRMLRGNTGLGTVDIRPIDVSFVEPLGRAPEPAPWMFLIVVDSLRADYLGAYNSAAGFTPRIAEFARESVVFRHAFTRYGGTGLSMPSIWMGAAGPHKQYVQPFQPMNALEKLLDANGYRRYLSFDHISTQLLRLPADTVQLDRGVEEMALDTCGTLEELQRRLAPVDARGAPVFAHTRSLNLHVASVRADRMPDVPYPGFEPRYAARVHRIDGCFGRFIDFLKRRGVYDRSLVVLMSDHGELLGEDGRWGHAYYLFPEILEIPLIVHLPATLAPRVTVDTGGAAFSTDLTPTLYAALGYEPRRTAPLMGRSLIGPAGTDFAERRRTTEVVAASYGAVYGALSQNGRRLYIVDANHDTEFSYEHQAEGWRAVAVTDGVRLDGQRAIREFVDEVAREYRLDSVR